MRHLIGDEFVRKGLVVSSGGHIDPRSHTAGQFAALGLLKRPGQHDLSGWAQLLVARRASLAMRYAPGLERQVVNQAAILKHRWVETLRYRANTPYQHEVRAAREVAGWFESAYPSL